MYRLTKHTRCGLGFFKGQRTDPRLLSKLKTFFCGWEGKSKSNRTEWVKGIYNNWPRTLFCSIWRKRMLNGLIISINIKTFVSHNWFLFSFSCLFISPLLRSRRPLSQLAESIKDKNQFTTFFMNYSYSHHLHDTIVLLSDISSLPIRFDWILLGGAESPYVVVERTNDQNRVRGQFWNTIR